ncbi:MAG: type II toxin-antitoxin system HicB family antitoxin [Thermomicrobiales bacterium]
MPKLPGCMSQGMTREEAAINIREAIDLFIEGLAEANQPVPAETFEAVFVAV